MKKLILLSLLFLNGCVTGALLNQYDFSCYSHTQTKDEYRDCIFSEQEAAKEGADSFISDILSGL